MTIQQITDNVQRRINSLNKLFSAQEITVSEYVEITHGVLDYWASIVRERNHALTKYYAAQDSL
jgi:hypothetical protein